MTKIIELGRFLLRILISQLKYYSFSVILICIL